MKVSENSVFVELLRGMDGLTGRDGVQGPHGHPEKDGSLGPPIQVESQIGLIYLHGAEYECPLQGSHSHNVPCVVFYVSTRKTVIMIPGSTMDTS